MYQEGPHPTRSRRRPYQARIRVDGCSSYCARPRANPWVRLPPTPTGAGRNCGRALSVYVFTGPTISAAEASDELDAIYLPPAAEGDVYRVTLQRPQAIGIIDGYFESIPAVRHKEILWAMNRGVHVFGSASMGALRAAELAAFGMEGVGIIFKMYHDGTLEDDDEVAVAHGPADLGYPASSEAMVNIRQTLRKAAQDKLISPEVRVELVAVGKELFYPDRNYRLLLRRAFDRGISETELG